MGHENGGWMNDDQRSATREAARVATTKRPTDVHGQPVDSSWYWCRSRTGQVVGVGKFAVLIGHSDWTFFINGAGYEPCSFDYVKAEVPPFPGRCEHGITDGDWCPACNREYKAAAKENQEP